MTNLPRPAGRTALTGVDAPLLTHHAVDGTRTALSAAELGGWAARTAGLLADRGLVAGSRAAVLLPPHWRTAAALLGAWSLGVTVSFRLAATAGLPDVGPDAGIPYDVVFVDRRRVGSWLEDIPAAPNRFVFGGGTGSGTHGGSDGDEDFEVAAGRFPADAPAPVLVRGTAPASGDGTTYGQWGALAAELARIHGIGPGDRVLVDTTEHEHPVTWLLAPLSAGASIVLCDDPARLDELTIAEAATRVLGPRIL